MTPQKQTIFSNAKKGVFGNCQAAVIASLIDVPIESIPEFPREPEANARELKEYLKGKGFCLKGFWNNPPSDWYNSFSGVSGYVIAGGISPRASASGSSKEMTHAVIFKNGNPFFDPHPSNAFIEQIGRLYLITRL